MTIKTLLTAGVAAFLLPLAASASTLDFAGPTKLWNQGQLAFADAASGHSAKIFAGNHAGHDAPFAHQKACGYCVLQSGNGLSILGKHDKNHEIDGNEYLTIEFDEAVFLDAIWFNSADYYDQFDMAVDNVDLDIAALFGSDYINGSFGDGLGLPRSDLKSTYSTDFKADFAMNGGSLFGSTFTFYTADKHDSYKIGALSFTPISPVPLPAGALLLLTGFGAFGAMRHAKRRA